MNKIWANMVLAFLYQVDVFYKSGIKNRHRSKRAVRRQSGRFLVIGFIKFLLFPKKRYFYSKFDLIKTCYLFLNIQTCLFHL